MHKGKVREMGTHQQLLAQRGIYYKLYQLQYKDQESPRGRLSALPQPTATAGLDGPAHASVVPMPYNPSVRILISAGEASGEMYGAQLIEALRRRDPPLDSLGSAETRMREAGCDTVVDAKDLAVVGITEILSHLPKIYGLFHQARSRSRRRDPTLPLSSIRRPSTGGSPGR